MRKRHGILFGNASGIYIPSLSEPMFYGSNRRRDYGTAGVLHNSIHATEWRDVPWPGGSHARIGGAYAFPRARVFGHLLQHDRIKTHAAQLLHSSLVISRGK
jgi:hypothetical protein